MNHIYFGMKVVIPNFTEMLLKDQNQLHIALVFILEQNILKSKQKFMTKQIKAIARY